MIDADPALVEELVEAGRESLAALAREIRAHHGPDLFDFLLEDVGELRRLLFDRRGHQVFTTAMDAAWWLDEHMRAWLGEENAADTLTRAAGQRHLRDGARPARGRRRDPPAPGGGGPPAGGR